MDHGIVGKLGGVDFKYNFYSFPVIFDMQASKIVLIIGSKGALGRSIKNSFITSGWMSVLCDVGDVSGDDELRIRLPRDNASSQFSAIHQGLARFSIQPHSVSAIVNASGGFAMSDSRADNLFESLEHMYSSSIESSVASARLASEYLSPGGLLVLPGSAAALGPTPWALTYGAMKAGVHHMVKSLGAKNSGMPLNSVVVGIAPVMLDTEANRRSMPDADFSTWTPLELVSGRIFEWASDPLKRPPTGRIIRIETKNNETDFIQV